MPAPQVGDDGAAAEDLSRSGRHTEPEWSRDLHDPRRDPMDAFEWLGFGPNRGPSGPEGLGEHRRRHLEPPAP